MKVDQLRGKWLQFKGVVKKQWGKLIGDDLRQIEGDYEKVIGVLQQRYGGDCVRLVRERYGGEKHELIQSVGWRLQPSQPEVAKEKTCLRGSHQTERAGSATNSHFSKEKIMIKRDGLMLCTALAGATLIAGLAMAADKAAEKTAITPGLQTVQGDVLKIEGDSYVVKDMGGKEIRLHVDKATKLEGEFKAGDKIEAQVTEKGHALSVTKPLVADAQMPGPQTVKGDVLKMDGEFYIVKDMAGKEIRLHVDKTTELEGTFKAGDQIEAQATEKNHALSIKHAQPPKM